MVRNQWNQAHSLRTVLGLGSFALLLAAFVSGSQREASKSVNERPRRSNREARVNTQ